MENPQKHIFKGLDEQEALLGNNLDWDNLLKQHKIPPEKRRFKEWVDILQKIYPEDPTMPKKKWSKDLCNFVADKLELGIDDTESLKFYKTLGTDLDRMGIDCLFVFKNPKTQNETVFTIDITINPQKDQAKADMIIQAGEIPDHHKDKTGYIKEMERLAEYISNRLKAQTDYIH